MPICFPSAPTLGTPSSHDLFQILAHSSTLPEPSTAPEIQKTSGDLWSGNSKDQTHTTPTPLKEHVVSAPQSKLESAISTLQGCYRELQHASRSELTQTRIAVERRMDELAEAMHSDMRRLRDDALSEAATNHSDVFRCSTTLSQVLDRLSRLESAFHSLHEILRNMHPAFEVAIPSFQIHLQQNPKNDLQITDSSPIALAL